MQKLQKDLETPPPWVADVSERMKRVETLDRGFSSLTDVVGNLMAVANVANTDLAADLDAVKEKTKRSEKQDQLAIPDPFQLQQFNALKGRLELVELALERVELLELERIG